MRDERRTGWKCGGSARMDGASDDSAHASAESRGARGGRVNPGALDLVAQPPAGASARPGRARPGLTRPPRAPRLSAEACAESSDAPPSIRALPPHLHPVLRSFMPPCDRSALGVIPGPPIRIQCEPFVRTDDEVRSRDGVT